MYEAGGSVDTHDGVLTLGNHAVSFGRIAGQSFQGLFSFCLLANGQRLDNIPPEVWNYRVHGGLILDMGTSMTSLVEPAYVAVTRVLARHLDPKLEKAEEVTGFEHCYKWDSVNLTPEVIVPKLVLVLQGGAGLELS